jgi:hypothetical protein
MKNDYENANTHAYDGVHLVVLAHLRRRRSLNGREGFGYLSPSGRACEAGFGAFCENETPIFHCVGGEQTEAKVQSVYP